MRKISLIFTLACCGSWLAACSSDSSSTDTDAGVSGTGGTTGGTGGSTGGTGGTATGGGGTGGTTGGTGGSTGGTGGETGGTGGLTGGTGGTGGVHTGGTGGTGGVAPPPPGYCDTHDKAPLPYDVLAHFTNVNLIGLAGIDYSMTQVANPDCDAANVTLGALAVVDGGSSDASTGTPDASTGTPDASTGTPDASTGTPDASTGTPDAGGMSDAGGGDAGAPAPSCYAFDYNPTCATGSCWGGVIFQSNNIALDDTMGNADGRAGQGFCIATGAMHVTFEARASAATVIKFGSIGEGVGTTEFWTPITTAWATYTIGIPAGNPYNTSAAMGGVWNGFSVVAANEDGHTTAHVVVQIRNVHWTN